jgi:hypothetical protein
MAGGGGGDHALSQGIDVLFSGYNSSSGTPKWHRRILIPRREVSYKLAQTGTNWHKGFMFC